MDEDDEDTVIRTPSETYGKLSKGARALIWRIMNGSHVGAYRAQGTPAEAEAIAAGAVFADHTPAGSVSLLWVTQEFADLAGGPRSIRPDRCTARPWPSCSRPDGQPLRHWVTEAWWVDSGSACAVAPGP